MSRKPRKTEGTRKRSLRLRSGRLYCLDRRSVSGASQGNSEASAADRLNVSAARGQPIEKISRSVAIGCIDLVGASFLSPSDKAHVQPFLETCG